MNYLLSILLLFCISSIGRAQFITVDSLQSHPLDLGWTPAPVIFADSVEQFPDTLRVGGSIE